MVYVGIDLGGMSAKAGVFLDGKLIFQQKVKTSPEDGARGVEKKLIDLAQSSAQRAGVDFSKVVAVGMGAPGVVDGSCGMVVRWGNYGWQKEPLGKTLAQALHKPVYLTNDANAAALGEAKFGAGKAYRDCVLITLGTGVGGGIVLGGKLFEGFCGAGAEIGHMVIETDGIACACGRKGCFEQYASARALIRQTRLAMQKNPRSSLWEIAEGSLEKVNGATVFAAAKLNDLAAQKVLKQYIFYLGEGIANLVNIFRPQAVILGGGLSGSGEELLIPLRAHVQKNVYVDATYAPLAIVCATLGNQAGIYGAYAYALQQEGQTLINQP